MRELRLLSIGLGVALCAAACDLRRDANDRPDTASEATVSEDALLRARLEASARPAFAADADQHLWSEARRFYKQNGYQLAWSDEGRRDPQVDALVRVVRGADQEGLDPRDYQADALAAIPRSHMNATRAVEADLLATYAFLAYASDVTRGQTDPEDIGPHWRAAERPLHLHSTLDQAARTDRVEETLRGLAPKSPQYLGLKHQLARYREIERSGGWPVVPEAPALRLGSRHPALAVLRQRLSASGDLTHTASSQDPEAFDEPLAAAVQQFQFRHGLEPNGTYTKLVATAVNVPIAARIRQIMLNMERWRWLADDLGPRYLMVNIPAFRLDAIENGRSVLSMKVVAGTRENKTPVLADEITAVVFSPYWNIPPNILKNETLPRAVNDPTYLARHNIEVIRSEEGTSGIVDPAEVDWANVDARRLRFRQRPGRGNSLGQVKFVFPNHYNVYLHDTPAESLFNRIERDFSHGCVRVEHPAELARYVLRDQPAWTSERIARAMNAGVERGAQLNHPLPIYLVYFTAWEENGNVQFRDDVYGYDDLPTE